MGTCYKLVLFMPPIVQTSLPRLQTRLAEVKRELSRIAPELMVELELLQGVIAQREQPKGSLTA